MVELGKIQTQRRLISDSNTSSTEYNPQYITDEDNEVKSLKEEYFKWLSRLVVLCAIVSLGLFLSASLVIFRLAPEIIVEPLLINSQSSSKNMLRYEPITPKMPSIRQFTELFIKQYIIVRNTVINDEQEMRTRWGPGGIVNYMSSTQVYREFVGRNAENVKKMFDNEYSSEVQIDRIVPVGRDSVAWNVDFTVYNLSRSRSGADGSLILKTTKWRASITPKYVPERRLITPRLLNPMGFTVMKYNQTEMKE